MKVAFSICTQSHLGFAITTRLSFLRHNPDYIYRIYIVDEKIDPELLQAEHQADIGKAGIAELARMRQQYTLFELCCSLKPFITAALLENKEVDQVCYFDTDMLVYDSMTVTEHQLQTHDIVLTLHATRDEVIDHERSYIKTGIANGGFYAVKNTPNGRHFINWWKSKTLDQGYQNLFDDMFSDQLWLAYVPFYFSNVCVLQHEGYNVAIWNLRHRKISGKEGKIYINGNVPLVFFHYSGFKMDIVRDSYSFSDIPEAEGMAFMLEEYYIQLKENGTDSYLRKYGKANHAVKRNRPWYNLKMRVIGKIFTMSKNYLDYYRKK